MSIAMLLVPHQMPSGYTSVTLLQPLSAQRTDTLNTCLWPSALPGGVTARVAVAANSVLPPRWLVPRAGAHVCAVCVPSSTLPWA